MTLRGDPYLIELITRDGKVYCEAGGRDGWAEPICPVCDEPIRWVLDMFSFSTLGAHTPGVHTLLHARCAWLPGAFRREGRLARESVPDRTDW